MTERKRPNDEASKDLFMRCFVAAASFWFKGKDPTEIELAYRIGWMAGIYNGKMPHDSSVSIDPEDVPEMLEALKNFGYLGGPTDTENR